MWGKWQRAGVYPGMPGDCGPDIHQMGTGGAGRTFIQGAGWSHGFYVKER